MKEATHKNKFELRDEAQKTGKVNVEEARKLGYVSLAEKEKLGDYTEEAAGNRKVYRKAMEHEKEIKETMLPVMEEEVGRKLEILGFSTPFPYQAINIDYRSVDQPYIHGSYMYGLGSDSYVTAENYTPTSTWEIESKTVAGLYVMVYEEKLKEMEEFILDRFSKYTNTKEDIEQGFATGPKGIVFIKTTAKMGGEEQELLKKQEKAVYQLYKENPERSLAEWAQILKEHPIDYMVHITLVTKKLDTVPTEEDLTKIRKEVAENPMFSNYLQRGVVLQSNLQATFENGPLVSLVENDSLVKGEELTSDESTNES